MGNKKKNKSRAVRFWESGDTEPKAKDSAAGEAEVNNDGLKETEAKKERPEELRNEQLEVDETVAKDTHATEVDTRKSEAEDTEVKESKADETEAKESETKEPESRESETKVLEADKPAAEDSESKEPGIPEPKTNELNTSNSKSENPKASEPEPKEPTLTKTELKKLQAAKKSKAKGSRANEIASKSDTLLPKRPETEELNTHSSLPAPVASTILSDLEKEWTDKSNEVMAAIHNYVTATTQQQQVEIKAVLSQAQYELVSIRKKLDRLAFDNVEEGSKVFRSIIEKTKNMAKRLRDVEEDGKKGGDAAPEEQVEDIVLGGRKYIVPNEGKDIVLEEEKETIQQEEEKSVQQEEDPEETVKNSEEGNAPTEEGNLVEEIKRTEDEKPRSEELTMKGRVGEKGDEEKADEIELPITKDETLNEGDAKTTEKVEDQPAEGTEDALAPTGLVIGQFKFALPTVVHFLYACHFALLPTFLALSDGKPLWLRMCIWMLWALPNFLWDFSKTIRILTVTIIYILVCFYYING